MAGKENAQIGLAGFPSDDFRQKGFPRAGIADQDDVGSLADELQVEQMQDLAFHLLPGFVMVEVEGFDSVARLQFGQAEPAFHGTAPPSLKFQVCKPFQCRRRAETPGRGVRHDTVEFPGHEVEFELGEFVV